MKLNNSLNSRENFIKYLEIKFKDIMYGDHPYMYHLYKVEDVAKRFLSDYVGLWSIQLACLGHDVLEDTDATKKDLEKYLSGNIIDLIERVTDKSGKNRKERHLNTYCFIREKEHAVIVKLCDRIANIEEAISKSPQKLKMYKKEADTFKSALYDPRHSLAKKLWYIYDLLLRSK